MAKVTIAKVEIGPKGSDCRILLSNGDELEGLTRFSQSEVTPEGPNTVTLTAIIVAAKA